MDSVTHCAGPVVRIGPRVIQRCAVCGEKLADNAQAAMQLNPDGTAPEFPTWQEGRLVEFEKENSLPPNFCLELVEL